MPKKVTGFTKLILPAGKATPAYPVGPGLSPYGINIMAFVKEYNERTAHRAGIDIPVEITIYADRSFSLRLLEPTVASLLRQAAQVEKGSATTGHSIVGQVTRCQLQEIAQIKLPDLNTTKIESAMKMIEGTARGMGIAIID